MTLEALSTDLVYASVSLRSKLFDLIPSKMPLVVREHISDGIRSSSFDRGREIEKLKLKACLEPIES